MNDDRRFGVRRRLVPAFVAISMGASLAVVSAGSSPAGAATLPLVWERHLPGSPVRESSPALVDLRGTGKLDVFVATHSGHAWGLRAEDGNDAPGWPTYVGGPVDSSPAIADLDGDGGSDIVLGTGTVQQEGGALVGYNRDGTPRFRTPLRDRTKPSPSVFATPAIGDITGDGVFDIAAASLGTVDTLFQLNGDGVPYVGSPFMWDDTIFASPALADVDGDFVLDVIQAGDATAGGAFDHHGGVVRAFSVLNRPLWEFRTSDIVRSSPSIGDLDRDGRPEVVFGGGDYYGGADSTAVYALDLKTGGLKWRRSLDGTTLGSPALVDVDADGDLEVAIGTFGSNHGRGAGQSIYVLDGSNGGNSGPFPQHVQSGVLGSVTTADVDGDGYQDLFVPTGAWIAVVNGRTGARMLNLAENTGVTFSNSAAIADLDNDGRLDVVAAGTRHDGTGVVFRWQLPPDARLGTLGWHQFRKDARRTGSWLEPPSPSVVGVARVPGKAGYWVASSDGRVQARGGAPVLGSLAGVALQKPVVGIAATPTGNGFWLVASDGGIFSFGDARFFGSTGGIRLNQPVVGMASTKSGNGYWMVARDGGIFTFGDAGFHGSEGSIVLNKPIVGMTTTSSGAGYRLVASDGGIFTHGDASFHGSTGAVRLNQPIVAMETTPSGNGYWMVARDGGMFTFGDAGFLGSMGSQPSPSPIMGFARNNPATGYWMVTGAGEVFGFGSATT